MCVKPFAKDKKELDTLTLKKLKGAKFMQKIKTAAKKAISPETAIPFYVDTEHKYSDGTEGCFLNFGKIKAFKADAKEIAKTTGARGALYVTQNPKGFYEINLMIAQGKIKQENKLAKALKDLIAPGKAVFVVGKELDEKALENLENSTEAAEEIADVEESPEDNISSEAAPTTPKTEETPKTNTGLFDQFKNLATNINNSFKSTLTAVAGNIKSQKVEQADMDVTHALENQINNLKDLYNQAEAKVKDAVSKTYDSIIAQIPTIEKIKAAIIKALQGGEQPDQALLDKMRKEFDALLKSADDAYKQLSGGIDKSVDDLKNTASAVIKGGKDLLKDLGL